MRSPHHSDERGNRPKSRKSNFPPSLQFQSAFNKSTDKLARYSAQRAVPQAQANTERSSSSSLAKARSSRFVPTRHVHAVTANHFKSDTASAHVRSRFKRACLHCQCSANEPIQPPRTPSREPLATRLTPRRCIQLPCFASRFAYSL